MLKGIPGKRLPEGGAFIPESDAFGEARPGPYEFVGGRFWWRTDRGEGKPPLLKPATPVETQILYLRALNALGDGRGPVKG